MTELCDLPVWNPLYLVQAEWQCPRCRVMTDVVALVVERYDDCLEGTPEAEQALGPLGWLHVILLTPVVDLPPHLTWAVKEVAPRFTRARFSAGSESFVNHCRCGNVLPDADVYGPGGPFDVNSIRAMQERRISVTVIRWPGVHHVRCDFTLPDGIEFIHRQWWRSTAAELLARLRDSTKPGADGYAAAVARALLCLEQAERHLESWKQGRDPFEDDGDSESPASADGIPSMVPEPWVDLLVWDPLFLITSRYRCWRCAADSPVAALLAERYVDLSGGASPASADPPADAQHVVLVSDIERMTPDLEHVLREAAPLIRRDRSRTAGTAYYMNHCRACGARFGDFFLGEIDGPFWASTPEEIGEKGITLSLLPVKGMHGLRAGGSASEPYVWAHEQWWRGMAQRLITQLGKRDDSQSRAYAVALERALGELAYVEREIDFESTRARNANSGSEA